MCVVCCLLWFLGDADPSLLKAQRLLSISVGVERCGVAVFTPKRLTTNCGNLADDNSIRWFRLLSWTRGGAVHDPSLGKVGFGLQTYE